MTVGIVGLGLIGGSLAKAYKRDPDVTVLAANRSRSTLEFAMLDGAVDGPLTAENLAGCDLVLIALYPQAAMDYMTEHADHFSKTGIVMDCAGVKREICRFGFPLAAEHGFTFVGGHPMAGTQFSGYKYSKATLYDRAPMVVVPPVFDDPDFLERVKDLLRPAGFGRISVTTAEDHDEMIAFTSQMCHVVSNGYIKSPTAARHKGFSAGSYKDLTRVAWLNAPMWSELILDNRENMLAEMDAFIANMTAYRDAIAAGDFDGLCALLEEGKRRKEEIDG